jgi:hypothetical protein
VCATLLSIPHTSFHADFTFPLFPRLYRLVFCHCLILLYFYHLHHVLVLGRLCAILHRINLLVDSNFAIANVIPTFFSRTVSQTVGHCDGSLTDGADCWWPGLRTERPGLSKPHRLLAPQHI